MGAVEEYNSMAANSAGTDLVVAHMRDGRVIKGVLQLTGSSEDKGSLSHLPDVLHIQQETEAESCAIHVAESKAVFFVRTHEGEREYEDVKFFSGETPSKMWVQVRLPDGEVLEGYTANDVSLLLGTGFWVWPADKLSNNTMIYVPKSSAVEFWVLGLATFSY